jgi:hypothetical protein
MEVEGLAVRRQLTHYRCGWLLAAAVSVAVGANAQPSVFGKEDEIRRQDEVIASGNLATLESLYGSLSDPKTSDDLFFAIRQIAAHGRSDRSSEVILEWVRREVPRDIPGERIQGWCIGKANTLPYLALTGGNAAQKTLRDVFLGKFDSISGAWWPILVQSLNPTDDVRRWETLFRSRAALGLLLSDSKRDQRRVRHAFQDLHDRRHDLDEAESDYYWTLLDCLEDADSGGRNGVLFPSSSDVPTFSPIRQEYMQYGHRKPNKRDAE